MVGNDVVDLASRRGAPRTVRPRFDERVFRDDERRAIARSADPHRTRWSLWAAKEAAYKAAKRMDDRTVWSPIRFRVRLDAARQAGCVEHASGRYPVRFLDVEHGVHAVAVTEVLEGLLDAPGPREARLLSGCRRGPVDDPSAAVRRLTREQLARHLGTPPEEIEVRRVKRIPELWRRGCESPAPLSLSHHGELVAWACLVPACGSAS